MSNVYLAERESPQVQDFLKRLGESGDAGLVEANGRKIYFSVWPKEAAPSWTNAKGERRHDLIKKRLYETLSVVESLELEVLENQLEEHLDRIAPLPFDYVMELHERLLAMPPKSSSEPVHE